MDGVVLGGEHRGRSLLGGHRSGGEWIGTALVFVVALIVVLSMNATVPALLVGLVIGGAGWFVFLPSETMFAGRSPGAAAWATAGFRWRRWTGRAVFTPAYLLDASEAAPSSTGAGRAAGGSKRAPLLDLPDAVGAIRPMAITFPGGGEISVLRHSSAGTSPFFTVTFEMQGGVGGLTEEDEAWRSHLGWSRFAASMARHGSLVTGLQQVARVVPHDTADHELWLVARTPRGAVAGAGQRLLEESYLQLLESIPERSEQHRTWLTIRMPHSPAWAARARVLAPGEEGDRLLALEQIRSVVKRARSCGLALRPLSREQHAGVLRALQDPSEPIDMPRPAGMREAFLGLDDRARRYVRVFGGEHDWFTRTAFVTSESMSGALLAPDFLRPLLTAVDPSVVRTITSTVLLTPAVRARARATSDASRDKASLRENRSVSDGSAEVQAAGSQVRLEDLRPGSGIHGASWTLGVTYTAATPEALLAADDAVSAAADAASITQLRYADGQQQAAHIATLPLGGGIREDARWSL
ncbi:hypothetical protein [Miniimonas sp. S16]|uniref:hypothetical protein n=1 Tax=Miniimonas sp. S16 TaxID=2171623 RepID=UPI000D52A01A|nr:hypothetical protein [Miniimonas sp. S16]